MALTTIPAAGAKLRGSVLSALITEIRPLTAYKTANETVNNSSTLQNDDHLFLSLVANAVYEYELFLMYSSGTTPDFKFQWSAPSGATLSWGGTYLDTSAVITLAGGFTFATLGAIGGNASTAIGHFRGIITTTNAGTLQLQWAQGTATVSDTILYAGSFVSLKRIS